MPIFAPQLPADVDHAGRPLSSDQLFPFPPPTEIGTVFSAASTARRGRGIASIWGRIDICLLWAAGVTGLFELAIALGEHFRHITEDSALLVRGLGLCFGPCAGLLASCQIEWNERCTFVGIDGIAEFAFRRGLIGRNILRFQDAFNFKGQETPEYLLFWFLPLYAGTRYTYSWVDVDGRRLFTTKGYYRSKTKMPEPKSQYYFAKAALRAWNTHMQSRPTPAMGFPVLPAPNRGELRPAG